MIEIDPLFLKCVFVCSFTQTNEKRKTRSHLEPRSTGKHKAIQSMKPKQFMDKLATFLWVVPNFEKGGEHDHSAVSPRVRQHCIDSICYNSTFPITISVGIIYASDACFTCAVFSLSPCPFSQSSFRTDS